MLDSILAESVVRLPTASSATAAKITTTTETSAKTTAATAAAKPPPPNPPPPQPLLEPPRLPPLPRLLNKLPQNSACKQPPPPPPPAVLRATPTKSKITMNHNDDYCRSRRCRDVLGSAAVSICAVVPSIRVTLIDSFDTETTLRSKCRDVSLNRVEDTFAVVTLPERRHQSFALNLTDESVRQITFKMTADLREVLAILDRDHQQKASFVTVLWSNTPTARNCE